MTVPMLMLDLNGTMVYRVQYPVRGVKEDLYIRKKYSYRRIGIQKFIKTLSKHFNVVIYTSIMRHNVLAVINAILPDWEKYVTTLYDRNFNKPDPHAVNHWDTVRDMNKIFRSSGYGKTNTILLDNEARKFQDTPENGIVVPEFGEQEVLDRTAGTLDVIMDYLLTMKDDPLFLDKSFDVRVYMKENPVNSHRIGGPKKVKSPENDDAARLAEELGNMSLESKQAQDVTLDRCSDEQDIGGKTMRFLRLKDGNFIYGNMDIQVEGKYADNVTLEPKIQLARLLKELKDCALKVTFNETLVE